MTDIEGHRPWGFYEVLADDPCYKVKRVVVNPGKRLSLQRHIRRSEHWYIVAGEGTVTLDDSDITLKPGGSIDVPRRAVHRMSNLSDEDLIFIEVQRGSYFGEDDIERLEDDYNRI